MSTQGPTLLQWRDVINVTAIPDISINVIQLDNHRVSVTVPLANIQNRLDWVRTQGSFAPIGYWKTGDVSGLFVAVGDSAKTDLDPTSLNFTTAALEFDFRKGTANDFVIPYVLFKLFGTSKALAVSVPNPTALTTDDPLLSTVDFAAAFNVQIIQSTIGTDVSGEAANRLFQDLISSDPSRFASSSSSTPSPVLSVDNYAGPTVKGSANGELNPWKLKKDDIIQFTVTFTFANSITVKDPDGITLNSIDEADTYSIRLQVTITA